MEIIPKNVVDAILSLPSPVIVGVSGFGGAGKSTAAEALGKQIDAAVIGVDSFFKNSVESSYRCWEIVDFERLKNEVIMPFRAGKNPLTYGHFDWSTNTISENRIVNHAGRIIIEGVGLFRPGMNDLLDYMIWIECPPDRATERGKARDRELYKNP